MAAKEDRGEDDDRGGESQGPAKCAETLRRFTSSNPLDSPENVEKANSQLGKISSWAKKIAKRMGFVDKAKSIVTALYNIFVKGVIIASQIVDVVWNLLSAAGPIGYFMDFGKWVASVSGAKDWLYREIDELIPSYHWR